MNVVVLHDSNSNKYLPLIRKKTSKSISEIKQKMKTEKPVMECNYDDADQLRSLVNCAEELLSMGACIKLYEEEELITLEMVRNLIGTIEGVAKDREAIDNVIFGDDSDE
ncbi:hypothetical protein [Bacillus pseudomycoides]|uniref:hypothetical protein n=3 Tax=Bacillus pseudomycoides TaxID=64104 RepID=UPI001F0B2346|nr:hypothetical protein [Bacillus pseudomycoides]